MTLSLKWTTLSLLAALSATTAAHAATRQVHAPEMYAATDAETEASESMITPVPHPQPMAINPSARKLMNTPTPTRTRPSRQELAGQAMPNQTASAGAAYDPVPSDQVDSMSRRLKLVEELIRRHGRAYDYRIHTVRELESILAKLEGVPPARKTSLAPTAAPALAAPVPTDAALETAPAALPVPTEEDEEANN